LSLFYGHGFTSIPFIGAIVIVGIMGFLNYSKVYSKTIYIVLGISSWFFISSKVDYMQPLAGGELLHINSIKGEKGI